MLYPGWKVVRWAVTIGGLAYLFAAILGLLQFSLQLGVPPERDTAAYWAADLNDLYQGARIGEPGPYLYSPAFAPGTVAILAAAFSPLLSGPRPPQAR